VFGARRRHENDFHAVRRQVGLLFQDSDDQLFCPTVGEDVAFGPLNLGKTREETCHIVRETLESLDLTGYEDRIIYKLSGGEKRLVALAAVLAMRPRVLLLDEPLAGLDEVHQRRIISVLQGLPQEMIVVSHDHAFLHTVTRRVYCLTEGRLADDPGVQ
jgi:cobalt/nickel transport system ATP-binding protein